MKQLSYTLTQLHNVTHWVNKIGAAWVAEQTGLPLFKIESLAKGSYLPLADELRRIEQLRDAPAGKLEVTKFIGV